MKALVEGGEVVEALRDRILGRVAAADVVNPEIAGKRCSKPARCWMKTRSRKSNASASTKCRRAHAAHVRNALRPVREVLRPRPRPRLARERRRSGRRDRRAVDRRAGHAADDAYVPHRRCGVACGGGFAGRSKSNGTVRFTATMRYVTNAKGEQIVISRSGEVMITRRSRSRARTSQDAVRRDAAALDGDADQGRARTGHMGSADASDHHRVGRYGEVRERRGRRDGARSRSTT